MDFFQSQDNARHKTRLLLGLFALAAISLVALTNVLIYFAMGFASHTATYNPYNGYTTAAPALQYGWGTFLLVSAGVLLFVLCGSAFRIMSLASGGEAVANMMNGELLADAGSSLEKRRLLNVVEEMAIASGTPVPPVYLIPDHSINAFAAGHSPGDAIVAVTQGAVDNLNREQLQGVIGHEFSHILNGDMRLNIRLMGLVYGILILAIIGRLLMEGGIGARYSRRNNGGGLVALGLGLVALGFLGRFFGHLIKAAISRQREFLADASSVQFTRSSDGIGGALKRIGGYESGTLVDNANSEEISHAFFAQGVRVSFTSLFATHPPLDARIRRLDPQWDGQYITRNVEDKTPEPERAHASSAATMTATAATLMTAAAATTATTHIAGAGAATSTINVDKAIGDIGNPGQSHIEHARHIIAAIPDDLVNAARETYSARAIVYLVLLDHDPLIRGRQIDHLSNSADMFVLKRFRELLVHADDITPEMRLPLLQLTLSSLRHLSPTQYGKVKENIDALIQEDNRVGLSEWALQRVIVKHLGEAHEARRSAPGTAGLTQLRDHVARIVSMLAYADRSSGVEPEKAFDAGQQALELDIPLLPKQELSLGSLNAALDALANLRPLRKPKLLKACIATISADGVVAPVEAELVRAIADTLDCPMPPILAGQRPDA